MQPAAGGLEQERVQGRIWLTPDRKCMHCFSGLWPKMARRLLSLKACLSLSPAPCPAVDRILTHGGLFGFIGIRCHMLCALFFQAVQLLVYDRL